MYSLQQLFSRIVQLDIPIPTLPSILVYSAAIVYSVIATIIIPPPEGKLTEGARLKDGSRLKYKLNGSRVHMCSIILFFALHFSGVFDGTFLINHYGELLVTAIAFSIILATILYIRGMYFLDKKQQNIPTSNPIINFWLGTELNPHFFGFELKFFSYRPAFVLQSWLCFSGLIKQYEDYGSISVPMLLFNAINLWYSIDCFIYECNLILMYDIIEENFGYMLVMGDYVWIPFVFSLQSLYLEQPRESHTWYYILNVIIFIVGMIIFRESNNQKGYFKQDPNRLIWGKKPEVIKTSIKGRDILCSGWWGIGRKINYLGDIMVAISMSMPTFCTKTGPNYILPWLYPIYLTLLLIHRAQRDNYRCHKKYGKAWEEYCRRVPYMILPGIY